jgi:hypothetical protein
VDDRIHARQRRTEGPIGQIPRKVYRTLSISGRNVMAAHPELDQTRSCEKPIRTRKKDPHLSSMSVRSCG